MSDISKRPTWQEYFFSQCELAATRSTCLRRQVGAVIVKDNRILASGYNGAPTGVTHCTIDTCKRNGVKSGERHELCRAIHAEQNAIVQAAWSGTSINGADIYVTHKPCSICTKLLINAGIKNVYYKYDYPDDLTKELLDEDKVYINFFHIV